MKGVAPTLLTALLAVAGAPASAGAGSDLMYHHRPASELPVLKAYHQQPYWRALAECAGIHGELANRYDAAGRADLARAAKDRGVGFLRAANRQLMSDRGLEESAALSLTAPMVDAGRGSGQSLLKTPTASVTAYSHEQIIDAMCSQLADRHARATRGARR
jgi:hypothetical protein